MAGCLEALPERYCDPADSPNGEIECEECHDYFQDWDVRTILGRICCIDCHARTAVEVLSAPGFGHQDKRRAYTALLDEFLWQCGDANALREIAKKSPC